MMKIIGNRDIDHVYIMSKMNDNEYSMRCNNELYTRVTFKLLRDDTIMMIQYITCYSNIEGIKMVKFFKDGKLSDFDDIPSTIMFDTLSQKVKSIEYRCTGTLTSLAYKSGYGTIFRSFHEGVEVHEDRYHTNDTAYLDDINYKVKNILRCHVNYEYLHHRLHFIEKELTMTSNELSSILESPVRMNKDFSDKLESITSTLDSIKEKLGVKS